MDAKQKRTISTVKQELRLLEDWYCIASQKRVRDLIDSILKENAPKIKILKAELAELESKVKEPKPRWPSDTPEHILKFCSEYWRGTTEYGTYRIHCWNDKAVWTSYPSGGYSTAGGWNPTPATFYLLSLTKKALGGTPEILKDHEGRTGLKQMQEELP